MSPELVEKLYQRYPTLYKNHTWGIGCGDGWFDIINILSAELEELLNYESEKNDFTASQIKEKLGGLRFYLNGKCSIKAYGLVSKAEMESYKTCEFTGKHGRLYSINGWIKCLCKEEAEKKRTEGAVVNESDLSGV